MATTRHSDKRDAILACLRATDTHPTANWIYDRLHAAQENVSRATVYRNLAQLRAQGQIISIGTVDGFERYDGDLTPHAHLICTRCGRVMDVDAFVSPSVCVQVAQQLDAVVESGSLMFSGICSDCKK